MAVSEIIESKAVLLGAAGFQGFNFASLLDTSIQIAGLVLTIIVGVYYVQKILIRRKTGRIE